jgi:hypothetical protein
VQPAEQEGEYYKRCATRQLTFPGRLLGKAGGRYAVRLTTANPPEKMSLGYWTHLDQDGHPAGSEAKIQVSVVKVRSESGRKRFEARFFLPDARRIYLHLWGRWTDMDGSDLAQSAEWAFYVKVRD